MTYDIHTDFPGGNVIVDRIDGDDVHFQPDLRDTEGLWFYWYFGVRGAAGRTLRFHPARPNTVTVMGPGVSLDGGWTWRWLGPDSMLEDGSFQYAFPAGADDVRLSMTVPYTRAHWDAYAARHADDPSLRLGELCRSRQGRSVPSALVGCVDQEPRHRVVLTARHHCCESLASYTMEGMLDAALADDALGQWFRESVQILALPLMDADGVEAGDQGKNRRPRDHNRDYLGESIYPETAALRELVPRWMGDNLHLTMDLHCPWIHGPMNEKIYLVGLPDAAIWREQCRLGEILERVRTGPLPYAAAENLPFGQSWNNGANFATGTSSSRWLAELPDVVVSTAVEIPYSIAGGEEVNAETARALGRDLARAIAEYLKAVA